MTEPNYEPIEIPCGGFFPRLPCGCHDDLPALIAQSGGGWTHIDGHGDAYAATEDEDTTQPRCEPCYGAVGRYTATWFHQATGSFRCAGCLRHQLVFGS